MKKNNIDFAEKIKHAKKYFKDGKFKEANDIYEGILKRGIHSYDLLFSYGILNKEIKNYKLAKNIFLFTIKNYSSFIFKRIFVRS